jgi:hypothetical protein
LFAELAGIFVALGLRLRLTGEEPSKEAETLNPSRRSHRTPFPALNPETLPNDAESARAKAILAQRT